MKLSKYNSIGNKIGDVHAHDTTYNKGVLIVDIDDEISMYDAAVVTPISIYKSKGINRIIIKIKLLQYKLWKKYNSNR
jgi:hypothetical protein